MSRALSVLLCTGRGYATTMSRLTRFPLWVSATVASPWRTTLLNSRQTDQSKSSPTKIKTMTRIAKGNQGEAVPCEQLAAGVSLKKITVCFVFFFSKQSEKHHQTRLWKWVNLWCRHGFMETQKNILTVRIWDWFLTGYVDAKSTNYRDSQKNSYIHTHL